MRHERSSTHDDEDLLHNWYLLRLLMSLKVGKFDADIIEHWTWGLLVVEYKDEGFV